MTPDTDRRGYFVKLDAPSGPPPRTPVARELELPAAKRQRHLHVRPLSVVLVAVIGALAWLQTTPGGISGHINDWVDATRGGINSATANPDLHRAETFYNAKFREQKGYPNLSEGQIRDDPNAGFGIGVTVIWCSSRAIVLQSVTGAGTVSRLLLDGSERGDVVAKVGCPTDLANPSPWKLTGDSSSN